MEVQALCAGCWRELALSRCPRTQRHGTVTWHCPHCGLVIATLHQGVIQPYARARLTTSGQDRTSWGQASGYGDRNGSGSTTAPEGPP